MKSIIGVYESHDKAVAAVQGLKKAGYPDKQLSVFGKADLVDGHVQVKSDKIAERTHLTVGIATAAVLETLAIVGIFVVPGFGFLFGAGAIVGLFAGLDAALLGGGYVRAIFIGKNINEDDAVKYERYLIEGKFLVFADGDDTQSEQAHRILEAQGLSMELCPN